MAFLFNWLTWSLDESLHQWRAERANYIISFIYKTLAGIVISFLLLVYVVVDLVSMMVEVVELVWRKVRTK